MDCSEQRIILLTEFLEFEKRKISIFSLSVIIDELMFRNVSYLQPLHSHIITFLQELKRMIQNKWKG